MLSSKWLYLQTHHTFYYYPPPAISILEKSAACSSTRPTFTLLSLSVILKPFFNFSSTVCCNENIISHCAPQFSESQKEITHFTERLLSLVCWQNPRAGTVSCLIQHHNKIVVILAQVVLSMWNQGSITNNWTNGVLHFCTVRAKQCSAQLL